MPASRQFENASQILRQSGLVAFGSRHRHEAVDPTSLDLRATDNDLGSGVTLRLEIDAEVPSGLDRLKVRTLMENASKLGFIDKVTS